MKKKVIQTKFMIIINSKLLSEWQYQKLTGSLYYLLLLFYKLPLPLYIIYLCI